MNIFSCGGLLRDMSLNSFVSICTSRRNNCGKTKKGLEQLLRSRRWAVDKQNRSNKSSPVGYKCVKLCRRCGRAAMLHHSRHGSQTAGGSCWRLTDCSAAPRMDVSAKNFKLEGKWNTSQRVQGGEWVGWEGGYSPAISKQKQLATFTLNETFICQVMLWLERTAGALCSSSYVLPLGKKNKKFPPQNST